MLKVPETILDYNPNLKDCVLFDLDNTIAYHVKRQWFEWEKLLTDWCDPRYVKLVNIFKNAGVHVVFFTGRPKKIAEDLTKQWLEMYFDKMINEDGTKNWDLILADCDNLRGADSKCFTYNQNIKDKYNVICSFDDSQSCVEMWRNLGILTLQTNNGMK